MAGQVGSDTADHVRLAAPQVALAVLVEIDRILAVAAGDELRHAHGAGIGAAGGAGIDPLLAREQQEVLELAAEECRARRVLEGQRGERVQHRVATLVAAVIGLDAEDRGDDLRRHAVARLCPLQQIAMRAQELDAGLGPQLGHEDRAIPMPGQALGRPRDRLQRRVLALDVLEQPAQLGGIEALALRHLLDEPAHAVLVQVRGAGGQRQQQQQGDRPAKIHVASSRLWDRMDMIMPNAPSNVTTEVPP